MMNKCTDLVTDWMIRYDVIQENNKELYQYAICSGILLVIPLLLAGGIGFYFGSIKKGIIMILPFMILRKFSGGFHLKNLWLCLAGSSVLLFLCMLLTTKTECDLNLAIVTVGSAISLSVFSPIENENRELNHFEKQEYKKITIYWLILFLLLDLIFICLNLKNYVICFSIGIQLVAGLQIPCVIIKWRNDQKRL